MKKIMYIFTMIFAILLLVYGILWLLSIKKYPVEFGISFNQDHASSLGLDWKETYIAMLDDLKPKYIRIAAMWSNVEQKKGGYNFSTVDFMMDEAYKRGTKVTLVVGQKAPRWPECHVPEWTTELSAQEYEKELMNYIETVVIRYKNHDALELWQVENEPFIGFKFGDCENFREDLVDDEIALVKKLDTVHITMVTDSGELSTWLKSAHAGDIFGTTVYRIVRLPNGMRWSYDFIPAGFYRLKAKILQIPLERFYIAELQAEPWFTDSNPNNTALDEQLKTMNPKRLASHIDFAKSVGTRRAYLWGVEWWYWMKEVQGKSEYWDLVSSTIQSGS